MPYFLSIPHYLREIREIESTAALRNWLYFKLPYLFPLASFPRYVAIEVTTLCNLRCRHCWRPQALAKRGVGSMAVSLFAKIIREISRAPRPPDMVKIGGAGEPALHPQFRELMACLEVLRAGPVRTAVYTNGTLFDLFAASEITRWNIDRIVVSVDGVDPQTYEQIRLGGAYHKLRGLVGGFRDFRRHASLRRPWLEIRHVVMDDETVAQLRRFRRFWRHPGDSVKFQSLMAADHEDPQTAKRTRRGVRREIPIEWNGNVPITPGARQFAGNVGSATIQQLWRGIGDLPRRVPPAAGSDVDRPD